MSHKRSPGGIVVALALVAAACSSPVSVDPGETADASIAETSTADSSGQDVSLVDTGLANDARADVLLADGNHEVAPPVQGAPGCGLASAAFCDTFDEGPSAERGRAGELNPMFWSGSRSSNQDYSGPGKADPVPTAPIPACRPTWTSTSVLPDDDTLICDAMGGGSAQLMTAVAAHNYGVNSYRIRQPFDFAAGTGKIVFDVDAFIVSGLAGWVAIDLLEDPVPAIDASMFENHLGPVPKNGFSVYFDNDWCNNANDAAGSGHFGSVGHILVWSNYTQSVVKEIDQTDKTGCVATAPGSLNHVEIDVSRDHLDVSMSDASSDEGKTFPNFRNVASVPLALSFTRGYVHASVHNHATAKYGYGGSLVHRWDNVGFDGPVIASAREYEIADARTPSTVNSEAVLNMGYIIEDSAGAPASGIGTCCPETEVSPLRFQGVKLSGAVSARLAFNSFYMSKVFGPPDLSMTKLQYRFNGGTWRDRPVSAEEAASMNAATYVFVQVADVPITDLVEGDNTLELTTVNSPASYPTVLANIDLIVQP